MLRRAFESHGAEKGQAHFVHHAPGSDAILHASLNLDADRPLDHRMYVRLFLSLQVDHLARLVEQLRRERPGAMVEDEVLEGREREQD